MNTARDKSDGCPGGCSNCQSARMDGRLDPAADPFGGWRLVGAASLAFLLPMVLAMAAAAVVHVGWPGAGQSVQALAVVGGVLVGAVAGAAASRRIRPRGAKEQA